MPHPRSPLWQALGATAPLFSVTSSYLDPMNDRQLAGITVDAGTTMAGFSTASATIDIAGYRPVRPLADQRVYVDLTDYGTELLSDLTGVWPDLIKRRFQGRTAQQTVRHIGPSNARKNTQIIASDWTSLITQLPQGAWAYRSNPGVDRLYGSLWRNNSPVIPGTITPEYQLQLWGSAWHHVAMEDDVHTMVNVTGSEVAGKFTADIGNLVRMSKDGTPTAWSHDHIVSLAETWDDINPHPLQTHQVLAPAEWRIPATYPVEVSYTYRPALGSPSIGNASTSIGQTSNWLYKTLSVETDQVYPVGGLSGIAAAMRARAHRESGSRYRITSLEIDALALIRRNAGTDRAMIGQLLTLDHGDPMALSSDWEQASGVYFVERIAHAVTPTSWTITLDLAHSLEVTGSMHGGAPRGRTWDTAYPVATTWDTPITPWETSP